MQCDDCRAQGAIDHNAYDWTEAKIGKGAVWLQANYSTGAKTPHHTLSMFPNKRATAHWMKQPLELEMN